MEREDRTDNDEDEGPDKEERRENGRGGKENRPQRHGGQSNEEEIGEGPQNGEGEEEQDEDAENTRSDSSAVLSDEVRSQRSCVTVTLQPSRGRRDPSTIVPKLEANMSTRSLPQSPRDIHGNSLLRPPIRNGLRRSDKAPPHARSVKSHTDRPHLQSPTLPRSTSKHAHMGRRLGCNSREPHHSKKSSQLDIRKPSASPLSRPVVPRSAEQNGTSEPGWERLVWVSVFRYLTRAELCVCMAVCKNWYKW